MTPQEKIDYCRGLISDSIRLVDLLAKQKEAGEVCRSWIESLVDFIEKECGENPDLRAEIEKRDFATFRNCPWPAGSEAAFQMVTGGVKQLFFLMDFLSRPGARLPLPPPPGPKSSAG